MSLNIHSSIPQPTNIHALIPNVSQIEQSTIFEQTPKITIVVQRGNGQKKSIKMSIMCFKQFQQRSL